MEDLVSGRLPSPTAWRGRRIFLTGHTGFKGGWLALWLVQLGAVVRGYSLDPDPGPSFFSAAGVGGMVEDVRGDIRDRARLDAAMRAFAPEVVLHLAAQPLVRRSYADPVETYSVNVLGTAHLLESMRSLPSVRAAVIVTTDKCYQNRDWHWSYRENDPLGGHDPYSSSKACVEILTASYRSSFFTQGRGALAPALATARAGNVIGGGDWAEDRLVPDLIRGFLANDPTLIRNPSAVRPWQHVLEPLAGYLLLAEALFQRDDRARYADAWNFGPSDDDAWPVARIATRMAGRWGGSATWEQDGGEQVHEAASLKLDASKARGELGWAPRLKLETAIDWLTDWYRAWDSGKSMQRYSLDQIAAYERLGVVQATNLLHALPVASPGMSTAM